MINGFIMIQARNERRERNFTRGICYNKILNVRESTLSRDNKKALGVVLLKEIVKDQVTDLDTFLKKMY